MIRDLTPQVARLLIYPIKSLDPVDCTQASLLASGALQHDREYALFDRDGNFVNSKRHGRVHLLQTRFDLEHGIVTLQEKGQSDEFIFHIEKEKLDLETWLSQFFGFAVELRQDLQIGFPDDTASPGPTIISTATLETIASWYPTLTASEIRQRFRANIEISGVPAFWEDGLFGTAEQMVEFRIGVTKFLGINPCQRCIVPTRDPQTGQSDPTFQKIFVTKRRESLPDWAERSRFNHFYRLAINTRSFSTEAGKTIHVGDEITSV